MAGGFEIPALVMGGKDTAGTPSVNNITTGITTLVCKNNNARYTMQDPERH